MVNNASTDKTADIARSFTGVKVVDENRKGLPMARQAGFLASTGDLIANIDADTIMPSGWIKKVLFEFSKNEKMVALSGPHVFYDCPQTINIPVRGYYLMGYVLHLVNHHLLGIGAVVQGGNFILRRSALEKIGGFDSSIAFYGEDTDIARRVQKHGRVKFTLGLPMSTSGRRFSQEGFLKTAGKYTINYFWVIFFKKPFKLNYTYVGKGENKKAKKKYGLD